MTDTRERVKAEIKRAVSACASFEIGWAEALDRAADAILALTPEPPVREGLAKLIGSFPAHDDDRGPDNLTLIDYLPNSGQDGAEGFLYRLVDTILAALAHPVSAPEAPEMKAQCVITNCNRSAPPHEPFCSKHRSRPTPKDPDHGG